MQHAVNAGVFAKLRKLNARAGLHMRIYVPADFDTKGKSPILRRWAEKGLIYKDFVSVVTWFVPILEYAVSNLMKLSVDIRRLVDLGKKCDELESIIANGEITKITSDLILLQHMILENREKAYMVPDWFYECRQPKYQKREEKIAEDFRKIDSNN